MARLAPPVAAVRLAVRRALLALLGELDRPEPAPPPLILVACSGGADSLALAAATRFVAPRTGCRAGLLTVDHGLQPGSAAQAATVAEWATGVGLAPVRTLRVEVADYGGGPEAAARAARYKALTRAA